MSKPNLFSVIFLLFSFLLSAQEIYDYEKPVSLAGIYSREITFKTAVKKDSITLSGTLLYPEVFDKVVIIVPGSGADTRNSHYKLTEALLKSKTAVYRYDERGLGKSQGTFNTANYTVSNMADELQSCLKILRKNKILTNKRIGFLGHSQGGLVNMQAYVNKANPDFMIQWATPVQKHGEFLKYQLKKGQNSFNEYFKDKSTEEKLQMLTALHKVVEDNKQLDNWPLSKKLDKEYKKLKYTDKDYVRFPYLTVASEKDIVKKDFEPAYKNIEIPLFYIVGTQDTYVDPAAETQLLESFNNNNITVKRAEGLNHYLTAGKLTLVNMYEIHPDAVNEIITWINKL